MSQRESHQLWLKDIIEHLKERQDQLDWTDDPESIELLLEGMIRDLERGKLLCEAIKMRLQERGSRHELVVKASFQRAGSVSER